MLKSTFFEFNMKIEQQASATTISIKFAPPYMCLFTDKFETSFLEIQQFEPLVWFRYVEDISLYGRMERKNLIVFWNFLKSLHEFGPCITFTYKFNKENIVLLGIKVSLRNSKVFTDVYIKPTDWHQFFIICLLIYTKSKKQLFLARPCEVIRYAVQGGVLKIINRKWKRGLGKRSIQRISLVLEWEKLRFPT